jgi:hypothetical protein
MQIYFQFSLIFSIPARLKTFVVYTIEGYNLMADKEVSREKEVDENGKVIAYVLNGESILISRNKNLTKE